MIRLFKSALPLRIQIGHISLRRVGVQPGTQISLQRQETSQASQAFQLQQAGAHLAVGRLPVGSLYGMKINICRLQLNAVSQLQRQPPGGNFHAASHFFPCGASAQIEQRHFRRIFGQPGHHIAQIQISNDFCHLAAFNAQPATQCAAAPAEFARQIQPVPPGRHIGVTKLGKDLAAPHR